jgi:hypothetical protein
MSTTPSDDEAPIETESEDDDVTSPPADPVEQIKDQGEPAGGNFA